MDLTFPDRGFSRWHELHALLSTSFAFMQGRIDPPSSLTGMTPDMLRRKAETERLLTALGPDGRLVACAYAEPRGDVLYVGKLAVDRAWQGHGIARQIITVIDAYAAERQFAALELRVRIELVENRAAFAALGFIDFAQTSHAGYDHPTSIVMRRPVGTVRNA